MNTIKSKANYIQFLLDPETTWTRINIVLGENFRTLKGYLLQLNITPQSDATLVPFSEIKIENKKILSLDIDLNQYLTRYQIDISKSKAALPIANFIVDYNMRNLKIETTYSNSIKIEIEKHFFKLQVEDISYNDSNIENKKWFIVCKNKFGVYTQIKEPLVSQKRYEQIKELELKNNSIKIGCVGNDVWNDSSNDNTPFQYTWKLSIQPEFVDIIKNLITICSEQLNMK